MYLKVSLSDIYLIEFAELLEQLETEFYTQALAKFVAADFTTAGVTVPEIAIQNFQSILSHESAHVKMLVHPLPLVTTMITNSTP